MPAHGHKIMTASLLDAVVAACKAWRAILSPDSHDILILHWEAWP
jgi:hypothetical protein